MAELIRPRSSNLWNAIDHQHDVTIRASKHGDEFVVHDDVPIGYWLFGPEGEPIDGDVELVACRPAEWLGMKHRILDQKGT